QQLPITWSGPQPVRRLRYGKLDKQTLDSRLQDLKSVPLGSLTICSEIYKHKGYLVVNAVCMDCNLTSRILIDNIRSGNTKTCKCHRGVVYTDPRAAVLQERYSTIQQRCSNPRCSFYKNYGGRGIQDRFGSAEAFVNYVLSALPHPDYHSVDIGRIN